VQSIFYQRRCKHDNHYATENEWGNMLHRNVRIYLQVYTASEPRTSSSSSSWYSLCSFIHLCGSLKMEAVYFSETLVSTYEATRRQNPEERHHLRHTHYVVLSILVKPWRWKHCSSPKRWYLPTWRHNPEEHHRTHYVVFSILMLLLRLRL
jgi:hypothetical protein